MKFKDFKEAVQEKFRGMTSSELFVTATEKDELWETYLGSFPEGSNPIFRERTEHDCQCCKQFIRACGNVVSITEGEVHSIWDIQIGGHYQPAADALSALVKSKPISNAFLHYESTVGTDKNRQLLEGGDLLTWDHFSFELPPRCVVPKASIGTMLGDRRSTGEVFKRSLTELSQDAVDTVLELIDQNSLYRGEENRFAVQKFRIFKKSFDRLSDDYQRGIFSWRNTANLDASVAKIRNTAIGTLLTDISEGRELTAAVKSFEDKVSGTNYQRPTALITKAMIAKAREKVEALGFASALERRYAVAEDLTINNVLFADRNAREKMDAFSALEKRVPATTKTLDKCEEVSIETFVSQILPKAESIELLFENKHAGNMVSLVAPVDPESKVMFKWNNNFSWAYAGEVADSMKERVKGAGGRVDGVFRFTHSWNEIEPNQSLMDLHVFMPGHIHQAEKVHNTYGSGRRVGWNQRKDSVSGGVQDVDYTSQAPVGYIPIENITFPTISKMPEGKYVCKIHNWNFRNSGGKGKAEIEFDGNIYQYEYPKTKHHEWITVAEVTLNGGRFTIKHELPEANTSKDVWNVQTQQFHKVSMIMNSPNHWDGHATGNRHFFFMLEGCINDGKARGFFNEFLTEDLREHRKVFEVLGSQMKTEESDNQLSGLGFSSTQRNHVFCKVSGTFNRIIKLTF
jgi:hypothetical protein